MRTILALAVGFWIARTLYINFDKEQTRKKQATIKKRLTAFLEENGLSPGEAVEQSEKMFRI